MENLVPNFSWIAKNFDIFRFLYFISMFRLFYTSRSINFKHKFPSYNSGIFKGFCVLSLFCSEGEILLTNQYLCLKIGRHSIVLVSVFLSNNPKMFKQSAEIFMFLCFIIFCSVFECLLSSYTCGCSFWRYIIIFMYDV